MSDALAPYCSTPTIPDVEIKIEHRWERELIKKARKARSAGRSIVLTVYFCPDGVVRFHVGEKAGEVIP